MTFENIRNNLYEVNHLGISAQIEPTYPPQGRWEILFSFDDTGNWKILEDDQNNPMFFPKYSVEKVILFAFLAIEKIRDSRIAELKFQIKQANEELEKIQNYDATNL